MGFQPFRQRMRCNYTYKHFAVGTNQWGASGAGTPRVSTASTARVLVPGQNTDYEQESVAIECLFTLLSRNIAIVSECCPSKATICSVRQINGYVYR